MRIDEKKRKCMHEIKKKPKQVHEIKRHRGNEVIVQ
jgi:hypothetical protein